MTRALLVVLALASCAPPVETCTAGDACPARGADVRSQQCCADDVCRYTYSDGTEVGPYNGADPDDAAEAAAAAARWCASTP